MICCSIRDSNTSTRGGRTISELILFFLPFTYLQTIQALSLMMEVSTVARKSLFDWSPLFNGLKEGGEDAPPPPPAIVTAVTEFSREPRIVKLGGPLPIENERQR